MFAEVAQSVEQGTENPRVGGSIPSLGTTFTDGKANEQAKEEGYRQLRLYPSFFIR